MYVPGPREWKVKPSGATGPALVLLPPQFEVIRAIVLGCQSTFAAWTMMDTHLLPLPAPPPAAAPPAPPLVGGPPEPMLTEVAPERKLERYSTVKGGSSRLATDESLFFRDLEIFVSSRAGQQVAIGMATEGVQPPGTRTHRVRVGRDARLDLVQQRVLDHHVDRLGHVALRVALEDEVVQRHWKLGLGHHVVGELPDLLVDEEDLGAVPATDRAGWGQLC